MSSAELKRLRARVAELEDELSKPVDLHGFHGRSSFVGVDKCELCKDGSFICLSWSFSYTPQGKERVNIDSACNDCLREFIDRDPEMHTQRYWDTHPGLFRQLYGAELLPRKWLSDKGIILHPA
jgi:hypothetical protein